MLFTKAYSLFAITILVLFQLFAQTALAKETIGWVEFVSIYPGNLQLKAKMDSGAKTSSLHCDCQNIYKKNGKQWIKFTVKNENGQLITLERKVIRMVKIKRHFGEAQRRAVIRLGVCLANTYKEIEVNIIDRSGLNYQMLIGRNYLAGDFLIDTGSTFTSKPKCKK